METCDPHTCANGQTRISPHAPTALDDLLVDDAMNEHKPMPDDTGRGVTVTCTQFPDQRRPCFRPGLEQVGLRTMPVVRRSEKRRPVARDRIGGQRLHRHVK